MTTLFLRDSLILRAEELPGFTVNLDGVALIRRVLETSIACVQNFLRSPRFAQAVSSATLGLIFSCLPSMLLGRFRDKSTCDPWKNVHPEGYESTVVDLKKAFDAVVVRRKDSRDTSERCFGLRSVDSSEVREPTCRTGVRISDVVEGGEIQYLSESMPALDQPCGSSTTVSPRSPGKGKRKRSATPAPAAAPKRLFEIDDDSIVLPMGRGVYFDDPNFECALKSQKKTDASRRSGCSRRATPVFQSSPR